MVDILITITISVFQDIYNRMPGFLRVLSRMSCAYIGQRIEDDDVRREEKKRLC